MRAGFSVYAGSRLFLELVHRGEPELGQAPCSPSERRPLSVTMNP
jgi:hypothetical protein